MPFGDRRVKTRVGFATFDLLDHYNPRDVQNNINSSNLGRFYNDAWREYRGKFVFEL